MQKDVLVINVTPSYISVSFRFVLAVEFYDLVKVANLTDDFMQIIENECI